MFVSVVHIKQEFSWGTFPKGVRHYGIARWCHWGSVLTPSLREHILQPQSTPVLHAGRTSSYCLFQQKTAMKDSVTLWQCTAESTGPVTTEQALQQATKKNKGTAAGASAKAGSQAAAADATENIFVQGMQAASLLPPTCAPFHAVDVPLPELRQTSFGATKGC